MNNKLANQIEKIEEPFIWSDDALVLQDSVEELLDFDDDLKDALYNMVIKAVGSTVQPSAMLILHSQVQKTIKKLAEFQQEQE